MIGNSLRQTIYMFAGKVHALLCRQWGGGRVKGRDLYDYLWFLARDLPLNISYLEKQMIQSGNLASGANLNRSGVVKMLGDKFAVIDYRQAKRDLLPFINKPERVDLWSEHFFKTVTADKLSIDE